MKNFLNYIDRPSPIHRITGAAKLACLLLWVTATMITFNTLFLAAVTVFGFILFPLSRVQIKDVKAMFIFLIVFMFTNSFLSYLISPEHGCDLYGTRNVIVAFFGPYTITKEELLYLLNLLLKYTSTIPLILVFVASTNPSELAASLNKLGISYSVAYAAALAIRFVPDTVSDFIDISRSQQARGVEMSKKESLINRLKSAAVLIMPLVLNSVERIDILTNAMELRKFGTQKKRTWIMARKSGVWDYVTYALGFALLAYVIYFNYRNGGRYWNPFV